MLSTRQNHKTVKKKILVVVGTRPNFVKITQLRKEAERYSDVDLRIVHTGQHYDNDLSNIFLKQFEIKVDYFLEVSKRNPNSLIGEIILKLESVIEAFKPDLLLSVGDVNSTLAASICANKMGVKLGHIESGLRSNDRAMPEEINRILTDELADICFITEESGLKNLRGIGKREDQLAFVGNTMIDTLVHFDEKIEAAEVLEKFNLENETYILVTMHRPSNVDEKEAILKVFKLFEDVSQKFKLVFPMHPRTKNNLTKFGLYEDLLQMKNVLIIEPQSYFAFQKLVKYAYCIITDSGGIQEETTFRKIPCITYRKNTERPVTIEEGTNMLFSFEDNNIMNVLDSIGKGKFKKGKVPRFWDGNASKRIIEKCIDFLS